MKIIMLNDSSTFYMMSGVVYIGKVAPKAGDDVPTFFVRELVTSAGIENTWRNVIMDNWFVSVPLFKTLLKDYQLRAVGTVRKNRRGIPANLKAKAEVGSSRFVFTQELTLLSFVPKKNKIVLLLSSLHHKPAINETTQKPEMIMTYNKSKGGTDAFDQKCHTYTTARGTRRWPLKFFFNMLDQAGINAFVLYNLNAANEKLNRCQFLKKLGFCLVESHLRRRLESQSLRLDLRKRIENFLGVTKILPTVQIIKEQTRAKCAMCEREQATRTRMKCSSCLRRVCDEHRAGLCINCVNNVE